MIIKKLRSCDGQSMVEFALVIPLVLMLLLGMVEFGRVYSAQLAVDNAARQGARLAAVGASDDDAKAEAVKSAFIIGLTVSQVTVSKEGGNVRVNVKYPAVINIPFLAKFPLDIESEVVMRME